MGCNGYFITGTDTDVGKTISAARMMLHLNGAYWKPIQVGVEEKDEDVVRRLTEYGNEHFFPSTYVLIQSVAPNESARRDGVDIEMERFVLPKTHRPLIVEGAGGLLVPLNSNELMIDLITQLGLPVILVCRSMIGTINHTLLSLEALRYRDIAVAGLIVNGPRVQHILNTIKKFGKVPIIAEIDRLNPLNKQALLKVDIFGATSHE